MPSTVTNNMSQLTVIGNIRLNLNFLRLSVNESWAWTTETEWYVAASSIFPPESGKIGYVKLFSHFPFSVRDLYVTDRQTDGWTDGRQCSADGAPTSFLPPTITLFQRQIYLTTSTVGRSVASKRYSAVSSAVNRDMDLWLLVLKIDIATGSWYEPFRWWSWASFYRASAWITCTTRYWHTISVHLSVKLWYCIIC